MSIESFFSNLLHKAVSLFGEVKLEADKVFHFADQFVNTVKKLESSEVGQFIEIGIETAFPVTTVPINAIKLWFTNAAAKLANVEGSVHTDEAKIQAFLDYLNGLKVSDATLYAGTLNTLNASLQKLLAGDGAHNLTTPMALVASQLVHDETLGTGK